TDRSSIAPGVTTVNDDGFVLSYGAGVGWDATDRMQVVLEWDRHRLNFAGGENNINMYTAGLRFKF
ncbi:MAG: hypothetical protein KIT73_13140, partial [Burkholderiales bacterium]|nr:hypothetical protein [Burkholderiales bacterium]